MKFHFLIHRKQGWYHFDEKGFLISTTKKGEHKQVNVDGEELHRYFLKILNPIYDYFKDNDLKIKTNLLRQSNFEKQLVKDKELQISVQDEILNFANTYGLGNSETFLNLEYELYGIGDQPLNFKEYSVFNLVEVALKMAEILLARTSYETVPRELKEICNRYGHNLKPQLNGGLHYEVTDIFASMFWTMAFTEYTHKVKECKWCKSPLLGDVRASFCSKQKTNRECKNKFNNPNRASKKQKKESK